MRDVIIERAIPNTEAVDALHEALKSALGAKCSGITARLGVNGHIRYHLIDDATAEDDNKARQIILNHDFEMRTAKQQANAERRARLEVLRVEMANPVIRADGKPADIATLENKIEWLTLEVMHLRDHTGST